MIGLILLWWCGLRLAAPVWYFVLLTLSIAVKVAKYGLDMYRIGAKHNAS